MKVLPRDESSRFRGENNKDLKRLSRELDPYPIPAQLFRFSTSSNGANRIEPETSARSAMAHLSNEVYHFRTSSEDGAMPRESHYITDFAQQNR